MSNSATPESRILSQLQLSKKYKVEAGEDSWVVLERAPAAPKPEPEPQHSLQIIVSILPFCGQVFTAGDKLLFRSTEALVDALGVVGSCDRLWYFETGKDWRNNPKYNSRALYTCSIDCSGLDYNALEFVIGKRIDSVIKNMPVLLTDVEPAILRTLERKYTGWYLDLRGTAPSQISSALLEFLQCSVCQVIVDESFPAVCGWTVRVHKFASDCVKSDYHSRCHKVNDKYRDRFAYGLRGVSHFNEEDITSYTHEPASREYSRKVYAAWVLRMLFGLPCDLVREISHMVGLR